jgi:hypothetical protein
MQDSDEALGSLNCVVRGEGSFSQCAIEVRRSTQLERNHWRSRYPSLGSASLAAERTGHSRTCVVASCNFGHEWDDEGREVIEGNAEEAGLGTANLASALRVAPTRS